MELTVIEKLKNLVVHYKYQTEFIIFGSPITAKNSKVGVVMGKEASSYCNIFSKQIERAKRFIKGIPFDDWNTFWVFEVFYDTKKPDVSLDLIFDLLEFHGIVTNDKNMRNYAVFGSIIDKNVPRIKVTIFFNGS